ncbi:MAG: glutaminase, partial [Proteobacteria bacterium]|nr:glutaminase [Pseudomonadota bacterium]
FPEDNRFGDTYGPANYYAYVPFELALPWSGERLLSPSLSKRLNALMLTCGTYDAAGEFAFRIGLPCKSGVGGGIMAIVPDRLSLCVWSPALDATGNSWLGRQALELFVTKTGLSVF